MAGARLSERLAELTQLAEDYEAEIAQLQAMTTTPPIPIEQAGQMIRRARDKQGISQETLHDLSGVGLSTLIHIESGRLTVRLESLRRVADSLGLKIYIGE